MKLSILPTYRGESKNWRGTMEGSLLLSNGEWYIISKDVSIFEMTGPKKDYWCFEEDSASEIKPETVEVSFNEGKTWEKLHLEDTIDETS